MKKGHQQFTRILALDLHPASLGYAVFENRELLDWGTRRWKRRDTSRMRSGLSLLIKSWDPTELVVRNRTPGRPNAQVQALARASGLPLATIKRSEEKSAFGQAGHNRFGRAAAIASRYAPLQSRLPEGRTLWTREPFQMRMFNAIAAGLTYLSGLVPAEPPAVTGNLPVASLENL